MSAIAGETIVERQPDLRGDLAVETVAEAYLLFLRSRGISNLFVNSGTDFAPLVEAYARLSGKYGEFLPRPVLAAHENLAMGMAHGAYLMTGKPQAVMFHVSVGTANAVCAAMNAAAEGVPILITAGRSPLFEFGKVGSRNTRVAWAQEMYDQASLVREAVKWDYELRDACQVEAVVDRALSISMTEPRGPVYLTLPREVLAQAAQKAEPPKSNIFPVVPKAPSPDQMAIELLADKLADAKMPVMSSLASGADAESVRLLAELCERFALGYVEEQSRYLNMPSDHAMHLGYGMATVLREADVLCFVESDVPWIEEYGQPRKDAFVAQCGVDPNFSRIPIRTHRSDLSITSTPSNLFRALIAALEKRESHIDKQRHARLAACASAIRDKRAEATTLELVKTGPINYAYLSAMLARVLNKNCTLFNEYWAGRDQFSFNDPRSYYFLPATGGLGWALPAAIGAKLVAPERTFVSTIGDGTYMFSNPAACHHASQKHDLPVLTIICNNARWNAVDMTAKLVYPKGHMTKLDKIELSDLSPSPAFERYVEASGGYGVVVSERRDLEAALRKALHVVEVEHRQALVNVLCE